MKTRSETFKRMISVTDSRYDLPDSVTVYVWGPIQKEAAIRNVVGKKQSLGQRNGTTNECYSEGVTTYLHTRKSTAKRKI